MAHTKEVSAIDTLKEEIHDHIVVNSWFNIVNFENWVIGTADDAEKAESWHNANSSPAPNYFKAVETESQEQAKQILAYFFTLGVPESSTEMYGTSGNVVYLYKTWM